MEDASGCAWVQVTLYQLLMEERYGEPIEAGLLWYLNQASPELVMRSPYEVRPFLTPPGDATPNFHPARKFQH